MGFKFKIEGKTLKLFLCFIVFLFVFGNIVTVRSTDGKSIIRKQGNFLEDSKNKYFVGIVEDKLNSGKSNQVPIRIYGREEADNFLPLSKGTITSSTQKSSEFSNPGITVNEVLDDNGFIYVGCFDVWIDNNWKYEDFSFDINHIRNTCTQFCKDKGHQVSLLRGGHCNCMKVSNFRLRPVIETKCDVDCPVSDLIQSRTNNSPKSKAESSKCGGNTVLSVYCNMIDDTDNCSKLYENEPITPVDPPSRSFETTSLGTFMKCGKCENIKCSANSGGSSVESPSYDYFPKNDPNSCALFCSRTVEFFRGDGFTTPNVRNATKYSILRWDHSYNSKRSICQCLDDVNGFIDADSDPPKCDTYCPGNFESQCGSINNPSYGNIYCNKNEYCVESSSSTTEIVSTTTETPCTTTNGGEYDENCDPKPISTRSTTTEAFSDVPKTSPITSTTSTSTPLTTTLGGPIDSEIGCSIKCTGKEYNGRFWSVCAGTIGEAECGHKNTSGKVIWKCSLDGHFKTEQPDYSGCHSKWFEDIEDQHNNINDTESAVKYLTQLETVISRETYFGHEIENVTSILFKALDKANNVTLHSNEFEKIAEKAIDVTHHVMNTSEPWHQLTSSSRSILANNLISAIESASLILTSKVKFSSESTSYEKPLSDSSVSKYHVTAGAFSRFDPGVKNALEFPTSGSSFLRLPPSWRDLSPIQGRDIEFVGIIMDSQYGNLMLPGQYQSLGFNESDKHSENDQPTKIINGKLISLTLTSAADNIGTKLMRKHADGRKSGIHFEGTGVQITFEHELEAWGESAVNIRRKLHAGESPKAALGSSKCVFWDIEQLIWSTAGCKMVSTSRFKTVCECNHLTSFAVLMDVHNYQGKELGLEILTIILCSMSFLCLFVSVIILSTIHGVKNDRTTITRNLSVCLLIGNTLVLLVLDRNYFNMSDGFCVASGILSHYVFLCAFSWMAIEGVHLYKMVVHVFDSENNPINIYRIISYGVPLLIVIITVIVGYLNGDRPYGGDAICWLDGNYIWSFMIPVVLVVMENFVILFIALKTAYQLQVSTKTPSLQNRVRSLRTLIRGCFSLTILLGLTWLIGFFTLVPAASGLAAAYLFTIINASQGIFIFVFHCLLNDKVRVATQQKFGTHLPAWLLSSSSLSGEQEPSVLGKQGRSNMKNSLSDSALSRNDKFSTNPGNENGKIRSKLQFPRNSIEKDEEISVISTIKPRWDHNLRRRDSFGTVSSVESMRVTSSGSISDSSGSGNVTDNSLRILVQDKIPSSNC